MSLVDVYDDLITKDLLLELEQYVSGFTYSRFETDNEEYDFKTNTHDFDHKDPLLIKCQQLFWNKLKNNVDIILTRLYCNKILAGDSPTSHYDGKYDVDTTVLVYVNSEWDHNEGGETLFYNEDKEVVQNQEELQYFQLIYYIVQDHHCHMLLNQDIRWLISMNMDFLYKYKINNNKEGLI